MPEWKPYQVADAGEIGALAESAAALADTVKSTLTFARQAMTVVKILAQLQNINPLLIALDALADEVLKQIANLKEAGYYYLLVDPYFVKNVTPKPAFTYGFEHTRNEGGDRLWNWLLGHRTERGITAIEPTQQQLDDNWVEPVLSTPRKLVPGGFSLYGDQVSDPLKSISPFPKFTAQQVVKEFTKAFEDEGDVPRYASVAKAPKTGLVVYDDDGAAYDGWDTTKDFGVQLWNIGDGTDSTVADFKKARVKVNSQIQAGKPSIGGVTDYDGGAAAIALVIGAPDFEIFADTFNKFSKMFTDIPEFAVSTGKSLLDSLNEVLTPANTVVKLTQCDTNYKLFAENDIIGGQIYGGLGKVISVNADSLVASTMVTTKTVIATDDAGTTKEGIITIDPNKDGRWQDMEITLKPIREADGLNPFIPGDTVYQMVKRGEIAETGEPNYVIFGNETTTYPKPRRKYAKTGKIAREKLAELPDSIPPDFAGIQIKDIIPGWGEFFEILENFVKQLKGLAIDSAGMIQDLIDMILGIEKFLEDLVKIITEFLEFFSIQLPSTGIYALHIPDQSGGNDGIKSALSGATGLPTTLSYSAGILFVGTTIGGINLIDTTLAKILQLN